MHGNLLDHGFFAWVDRECDRGGAMGEGEEALGGGRGVWYREAGGGGPHTITGRADDGGLVDVAGADQAAREQY